jgi:signal transduction histidine kinase
MGISATLRTQSDAIATRWRGASAREVDAAARAFCERIPQLVDGVALASEGATDEAMVKLRMFAEAHALDRHRAKSTLGVVLDEYAQLRRSLIEVVLEGDARDEIASHLIALHAALDYTSSIAVQRFEEEHDRVRERFIGMLVHDLRDPLTAVMMSANLLADMTLGERQALLVGRISRGARRIERMVDEVVEFARSRLGESLSLTPSQCDLSEVCHEAIGEHRAQPAPREIQLDISGNLAGTWDRERVRQAMINLLANASQGSQGAIQLRAVEREDHGAVLTSVTTKGPVLNPESLSHIFDPVGRALLDYQSVQGSQVGTLSRLRGLGLGLYLVERIAIAHGGSVRATSTSETGTTITVEWPRASLTNGASPKEQPADRGRPRSS